MQRLRFHMSWNVFRFCTALRGLGSIMILVVLGIVGSTYYAVVIANYGPDLLKGGVYALQSFVVLVLFHLLLGMLLWSYFAVVFTDPGSVPSSWKPVADEESGETVPLTSSVPGIPRQTFQQISGTNASSNSRLRYCRKCCQFKPPRCHHCCVCGRCILKMDHHCVWVVNCVGARNYKFFLLFLFYTFLCRPLLILQRAHLHSLTTFHSPLSAIHIPAKMFKKFTSEEISSHNQVKASVQRKIRQSILDEYPDLDPVIDDLLPKKSPLIVAKCQNHLNLVLVNNVPLFFNVRDGPYMPTLRLLHQYPNIMKKLQVDRGAIKFVLSGANVMCPGLTSPGGALDEEVPAESPVAIMAEGKENALAIGFTKMSAKDIKSINKGIGVDNMHYLNDGLWKTIQLN